MNIPDSVVEAVHSAIYSGLSQVASDPKRILTEGDAEAWIFRSLVESLEDTDTKLGVHCQTCFYDRSDGTGKLRIKPDIAIFDYSSYTIEEDGESYLKKGFSFNGSAILIEIKIWRGHRMYDVSESLGDIDKLARINDLHYVSDTNNKGFFIFVLYSRRALEADVIEILQKRASEKGVKFISVSANWNPS